MTSLEFWTPFAEKQLDMSCFPNWTILTFFTELGDHTRVSGLWQVL